MPSPDAGPLAIRRELYFFTLYRVFEAALLCLVVFSPVGSLIEQSRYPLLGQIAASGYLLASLGLLVGGLRGNIRGQVLMGIAVDIAVATIAIHALPSSSSGIAMMMLFNVGAAALLLPLRLGLGVAVVASAALVGEYLWTAIGTGTPERPLAELLMFTVSYLAIATLTNLVGRQMRATEALAEQRGSQVANLAEINELIIRRMRTGVLLVDGHGEIKLANEAAMLQLGGIGEARSALAVAAPELAACLQGWRHNGANDDQPLQLAPGLPEVLPRFARLLAEGDQVLVFLDDTTLLSRRAESMTLATLGRFSASLAHEIRNPLAAISYATQLLEESRGIPDADRRLLEIIYKQTMRMNGIVQNVLALARRERAQPEHVELGEFARHFVAEYRASHPLEHDELDATTSTMPITTMIDRRQLHQVVTALVHNALVHGRLPGQPARVSLRVLGNATDGTTLEVRDHGAGIPERLATQLFRPFFTTSPHGTGLGLYIARELCMANQATLEYVAVPDGGACFRLRLPAAGAFAAG